MADIHGWSESRLTGKLALDAGSTVDSLLMLSLATKQVLFHRNVDNPTSAALASFDAWTASAKLCCGDEQAGMEPLMLKVYKQTPEGAKNSYKALYSDGTYLLYGDDSQYRGKGFLASAVPENASPRYLKPSARATWSMADWLAQLHRRTSASEGSSSSSLEPTFRINNPRNRGRRVTSGGSIIRAPRRNQLSGDLSLSSEEVGFDYPVLKDWNTGARSMQDDEGIVFVDQADRRLVEPVSQFGDADMCDDSSLRDLKHVLAKNLETVNRMGEDEWLLR